MQFATAGYTENEVKKALVAPDRQIRFRYELLGRDMKHKRDLKTVSDATIAFNSKNAIMRTAMFTMREDEIDYLSARIRPVFGLLMRPDTWLEWPLGVFVLSSPERKATGKSVTWNIEAYDLNQLLKTDGISERLFFPEGTKYTDIVISTLIDAGISRTNIEASEEKTRASVEYPIGTYRLDIINEQLKAINYTPIYPDASGVFTAHKKRDVQLSDIAYNYTTKVNSIIKAEARETLDYFDTPNRFVAFVSSPELEPLHAVYENDDPSSPLSTKNRPVITEVSELRDIANQNELDAYIRSRAQEAISDLYGIEFTSGLMPTHGYMDVYQFEHEALKINEIYQETAWTMDLKAGGNMTHTARRLV